MEENVAVEIDSVPGSDHAIHIERPLQVAFDPGGLDGEDLQAGPGGIIKVVWRAVCKVHGAQRGCGSKQIKQGAVRNQHESTH